MRQFSQLFAELDATTSTNAKVEALQRYFAAAAPADAAWAVYFLAGGKPRQVVPMALLAQLACEEAGIAPWLFDECYQAVGDLAETIAHVLPRASQTSKVGLAEWVEQRLLPLRGLPPAESAARVRGWWRELDDQGRFLLTKLVGGGFRVGVSKLLVQRALAAHGGVDAKRVAQRMMGYTDGKVVPSAERFAALVATVEEGAPERADEGQPYPFFLAHQLDGTAETFTPRLGPVQDWQVEWKYDGIRGQVVKRGGRVWVWSRGEELVTEGFPEIVALAQELPDGTVLDGEILVWQDPEPGAELASGSEPAAGLAGTLAGRPAPFALLQQRIGRKTLTRKVLADAPVTFMAYDLLEQDGQDLRERPQGERRARLEALLARTRLKLSPVETATSWLDFAQRRARSRELGVEGFMLKRLDAAYGTGRTKADGLWWKWKIDPMTIDCVLVYAQAGHGRRASVYTDYTFAVWNRPPRDRHEADAVLEAIAGKEPAQPGALQLVAFAKAYSGLTDEEFRQVDAIIRRTTIEKFGPVRSVRPSLVFELGFEGINRSSRHKSGIAVRFPRMLRIRHDKPLHEADTLQALEALLPG
ncbi:MULTISPECIES: ATP-dependent DNA ligase [Ramlibacter]|uniref:DNA ligase (ATP) n=1 Tax=Ramlibacter pinisoli TaxID=2682844 RepID=A0A6N8IRW7_9BURK|nr:MULTISPECIES: ATP-dependent DNA ligase [Ramlibacter]MBA2964622.1 ATP-dependent DNA ligase [Ramlibacter sp. CGMCC 1.13660]MVQ29587.1 ATP-dependent DNA ligase [Ramlibacter pinisoli]